jgi:hypothetical protein
MKKKQGSIKKKTLIVRAYRIGDDTHAKLKELAQADDRKLGSKLTEIINNAHIAYFGQIQA